MKTIKLEMYVKKEYFAYVEVADDFEPTKENIAGLVNNADFEEYSETPVYDTSLNTLNQVAVVDDESNVWGVYGMFRDGQYTEVW